MIKGLGLGLTSAREVVHDHKGYIDFKSIMSEGTVFHIFLPILHNQAIEQYNKQIIRTDKAERILVVDDNLMYLEIMEQMLGDLGYIVISESSPIKALEKLADRGYDLLILDMQMEEMNGIDLYTKIKEIHPHQKTILITAYSEKGKLKQASALGIQHIVSKPVEFSKISKIIHSVINEPSTTAVDS